MHFLHIWLNTCIQTLIIKATLNLQPIMIVLFYIIHENIPGFHFHYTRKLFSFLLSNPLKHRQNHYTSPFSFPWHHTRPNLRILAQSLSQTLKGEKQVSNNVANDVTLQKKQVETYFKDKHLTKSLWPKCSFGTSGTQWRSIGSSYEMKNMDANILNILDVMCCRFM